MPADRDSSPVADVVFTAVSPVLIMLMVGSLVFFLITVLPTGDYKERLLYTSFFFVFGAVLVARIAIQYDAARASMYGLGLAVVTFLAMSAYVEYPSGMKSFGWAFNLGLMGLIWWSANKLTWDCTHVDTNRDTSGRGLLAASSDPFTAEPGKIRKRKKKESAFTAWVGAFRAWREANKDKPHTPGVWVLYFSVAALPLFAIGQSLIPTDDESRRQSAFLQMCVYVGSGLGLLATTSLLGLRRYLLQRKAKIPASLTAGWLGLGAVLIAVFLVVGAFLPRPYSEVPWFGLPQAGKSKRDASKYALLKDSAGKGDGATGNVREFGKDGKQGVNKNGKGKGEPSSGRKSGEPNGGEKDDPSPGRKSGESKRDEQKDGPNAKSGDGDDSGSEEENTKDGKDGNESRRSPDTKLGAVAEKIAKIAKWIVFALVALLIIGVLFFGVLKYLSPFTAWARNLLDAIRNWWANLFGSSTALKAREAFAEPPRGPLRPPPFSEYSNPFADGSAGNRSADELTAYTFEALDAWAWDRGLGRKLTETPLEFAARLGVEQPDMEKEFRRSASLYARAAYATGPLPTETKAFLEHFWESLIHGAAVSV
ncbi:MAG: DUF4129 domain-containing protein [Gemmataceae bacterium]